MKIIILGDSLSSIKQEDKRPEYGWGEKINEYINLPILNLALNGRSTKSFMTEDNYQTFINEVEENDLVLIQFGHNDQKIEDENRYTNPHKDYIDNLIKISNVALGKGAKVIILSSVSRLVTNDERASGLFEYHKGALEASKFLNVPFIPLFTKTVDIFSKLTNDELKEIFLHLEGGEHQNYPEGVEDNTHLKEYGAKFISGIICSNILDLGILPNNLFVRK